MRTPDKHLQLSPVVEGRAVLTVNLSAHRRLRREPIRRGDVVVAAGVRCRVLKRRAVTKIVPSGFSAKSVTRFHALTVEVLQ